MGEIDRVAVLMSFELSVDRRLSRRTYPQKTYHKRCYEKAGGYLFDHEIGGMILVHGRTVFSPFGHAWVELPGEIVFDGVLQRFFLREGYYEALRAGVIATYTRQEAAVKMNDTGNWGPWHGSSVLVRSLEASTGLSEGK